ADAHRPRRRGRPRTVPREGGRKKPGLRGGDLARRSSPPLRDSALAAALRAAHAAALLASRADIPEDDPRIAHEPREDRGGAGDEDRDRDPRPQRPDAHHPTSSSVAARAAAPAGARAASRAMTNASADAGSANSTAYSCHSSMVRPPSSSRQICVAHSSSYPP